MDGVSKPGQRGDAVLALLAAVKLASADGSIDQSLEAERVWQELAKEGTAFLSAIAAGRLPAEEAASSASIIEELLINVGLSYLDHTEMLSLKWPMLHSMKPALTA